MPSVILTGTIRRIANGKALVHIPKSWRSIGDILEFESEGGWRVGQRVEITVQPLEQSSAD